MTHSRPFLDGHKSDLIEEQVFKHRKGTLSVDSSASLEHVTVALEVIARRSGSQFQATDVPHDWNFGCSSAGVHVS